MPRIVILITFFIYTRAGSEIYKKHKQLRDFSSHHEPESTQQDDPFSSVKTTEVFVVSEIADKTAIDLAPLGRRGSEAPSTSAQRPAHNAAYSVTISSNINGRPNARESYGDVGLPIQSNAAAQQQQQPDPAPPRAIATSAGRPNPLRRKAAFEANNAAWSYTKCAILFFTAMLVTWIPSSANRVYSVVHTNEVSMPLEYMSALVLPLQGLWNAVIYMVTSWKACKMLASDIFGRRSPPQMPERIASGFRTDRSFQKMSSGSPRGDKNYETESMTELANSRPSSNDRVEKGN